MLGIVGKSNAFYIHTCIFITSWSCLVSSYSPLHPNLEVTRFIVVTTYPSVVWMGGPWQVAVMPLAGSLCRVPVCGLVRTMDGFT